MRTRLTDAQIWTILTLPRASDAQLAAMLGVKVSTVHNARWKLSRNGWSCSVRYAPCRHCGELATLKGQSTDHAYHARCRPAALRAIQQRVDAEPPVTPEHVARLHQWQQATQERTLAQAASNGRRWSDAEDAVVRELIDRPIEETCDELDRSLYAVAYRRARLRQVLGKHANQASPVTPGISSKSRQ
jgi:hypothetical protein